MSVQPLEALAPAAEVSGVDPATAAVGTPAVVRASGVLPWRRKKGRIQVALVHRPRYDDWSWPKGKLERGEDWAAAAARETFEETGMRVRLGPRLPSQSYRLGRDEGGSAKRVEYWAGRQIGGSGKLRHEVDKVVWLTPAKAERRLTYARDRDQLRALVAHAETGDLDTWALLVVRHAKATARKSWKKPDMIRPLTTVGKRRAQRLVPILSAYAPEHILTSPSTRCHDTMAPFAQQAVVPLSTKRGFSEEGFEDRPYKVAKHLTNVFHAGRSVAICTHGPVLEAVLDQLSAHSGSRGVQAVFRRIGAASMDKGEILACAVAGRGHEARIVTATRHRIPR
ncbi:MAG TPA: NUDIX hydrolase [Ornithinimicrobium sp.]|uniref:NUDIX hydrolase n=1 Tax=Ornithinimicrobium sp. TaxID=1977084 RepID=UPI002B4658F1|nr:NUDIX hydrolase [Ornithinimicrobium sp.]HKJ12980.1 NUDIX hydrolase [Ornithinimicrobium sp.]